MIKNIEFFLTDRNFKIKIEDCFLVTRQILAGVSQGLLPLTPSLPDLCQWQPSTPKAQLALFADDTIFLTKNKTSNRRNLTATATEPSIQIFSPQTHQNQSIQNY